MTLMNMTIQEFAARTASGEAVPGGGCVAALAATLAAALTEMVTAFTIGRPRFAAVEGGLKEVAQKAAVLQERLAAAVDRDAAAYEAVLAAYRLPKASQDEKEARRQAIEAAMAGAARVPLEVAQDARKVLDLAAVAVRDGNPNTVTDALVAALMARSAVLGAVYNVRINLASMADPVFVAQTNEIVDRLASQAEALEGRIRESASL